MVVGGRWYSWRGGWHNKREGIERYGMCEGFIWEREWIYIVLKFEELKRHGLIESIFSFKTGFKGGLYLWVINRKDEELVVRKIWKVNDRFRIIFEL